jgi:predicted hotdog family 3-hydroxylacyl-ACP dehydratase
MTSVSDIPVAEILPHGAEMTMIDCVVEHGATRSIAVATVTERSAFYEETGVPAWAGIELMAQTIAAHAGLQARARGEPPSLGFLIGARTYATAVEQFPNGTCLKITVEQDVVDEGYAAFKCAIETDRVVATALLTTYRPSAAEVAKIRESMGSV